MHARNFLLRQYSFILAANKEGSGGAAAPTVPELTAKVTKLEGELALATQRADKAEADLVLEKAATAKLTTAVTDTNARADKADADLVIEKASTAKLTIELATAKTEKETAEAGLKTSDDRAELKVRELYAANGLVLPAKKPGAGDHTVTEKPADAAVSPRQRLAASFKTNADPVPAAA